MTKSEILEKLKDFKDTDEIIFTKKVGHWVPAPEDSWDGDVCYTDEDVKVDNFRIDKRRLSKYRVVSFLRNENEFVVLCLRPYYIFNENDLKKDGLIKYRSSLYYNYKSIPSRYAFESKDELVSFINSFIGKSSLHRYNESEIIWGTKSID